MARVNNYDIQVAQAKARFLTYDQEVLIRRLAMAHDEAYLYLPMLARRYRISRTTGDTQKLVNGVWTDGNSHGEVMTLLDLICDGKEGRFLTGRWKAMAGFGLLFHQNLQETTPWAQIFQDDLPGFRRACEALEGRPLPMGDAAYAIELFDGLSIAVQLWLGDEEFPPSLRFLWDENALQYIRYETMYFARGMLLQRLEEERTAQ